MDGLRLVKGNGLAGAAPCSRCQATGCPWDRVADKPICPDCQERLALGEGEPLVERAERRRCAACQQVGTIRYLTYPLHVPDPVEIDLCAYHFQALLSRRLDWQAFQRLSRQLLALGITAQEIFLLHEAFYDEHGRALQPVADPD